MFACLNCGAKIRTTNEIQVILYGIGEDQVSLCAMVPIRHCDGCGFSYTDGEAEDARSERVNRYLANEKN